MNARQVLRWSIADHPKASTTADLVAACLQDVDWELRATAMLAVGLLQIEELRPHTRKLEWPSIHHAPLLRDWQKAIAEGAAVEKPTPRDHETILLFALLEPLSLVDSPFPHRAGYRYVAPQPHWLGDKNPNLMFPNPIRCIQPQEGYWISEDRVGEAVFEDALAHAADQKRRSGLEVRLPTADEWEMAARSTDARFYPWGNAPEAKSPELPSPWGLEGLMRGNGEWTQDGSLLGSSPRWGLPAVVRNSPRERIAGYRFVVHFEDAI